MMMDELLGFLFAFASLAVGARLLLPLVRAYAKRVESRADAGSSVAIAQTAHLKVGSRNKILHAEAAPYEIGFFEFDGKPTEG